MRVLKQMSYGFLMVSGLSILSFGSTPTAINYQGRLTNAGGTPVADGNYSVVFTIYNAASGGTSKWTETQSVTTSGGLFAVLLGTINTMTDTVFNASIRYLGVKVGGDPELTPRTRLVSVPYSDRVNTVDGSTGGHVSGNIDLDPSSLSGGNITKGSALFIHNTGTDGTFIGANAGSLTTTAANNTGVGANALLVAGTAGGNTAVGANSLKSDNTGTNNTAVGVSAMASTVNGGSNSALGVNALLSNQAGDFNVAMGVAALQSNVAGSHNTAVGTYALLKNLGDGNTALGSSSLYINSTGQGNTAVGSSALVDNDTGNQNVAVGSAALFFNNSSDNCAVGSNSLLTNSTGHRNTAIGSQTLYHNTIGNENVSLGAFALNANQSGSGNTATGTNALLANTIGITNVATGTMALSANTTGSGNTAIGSGAMAANTIGFGNTVIGSSADVSAGNLSNATAIGNNATVNASNKIRLGNSAVTVIEGQVAYTFTSDRNQKENFQLVDGEDVLSKISQFKPTSWNYKNNDPARFRHYGPMAQEFFAAFGHDTVGQCGDSITMNSGDEAGILFAAVQTLERDRERLTSKVEMISDENEILRTDLETLKEKVSQLLAQNKQAGSRPYSQK